VHAVEQTIEFNRQLVCAFVAAGIPVLTGTDSGVPGVVPGFALHDELEALVKAGMGNPHVLEASMLRVPWSGDGPEHHRAGQACRPAVAHR
jgi:hypothetical protein